MDCARGPEAKGDNALYQFYATKDSNVFLAGPFDSAKREEAATRLVASLGIDAHLLPPPPPPRWSDTDANKRWSEAIGAALALLDTHTVVGISARAGMTACRLTSMADIRRAYTGDAASNGAPGRRERGRERQRGKKTERER